MNDRIDALQAFRQSGLVGEITSNELHLAREDWTPLADGEVVEHDHFVGAACRQMPYKIDTYEASSPRYKYAHTATPRSILQVPLSNRYHHFETQGIFVRSQLVAYLFAILLISSISPPLSVIGSRPRPLRLRFST